MTDFVQNHPGVFSPRLSKKIALAVSDRPIANNLGSEPDFRMLVPKSSQICPSSNCWLRIWRYLEGSVAVPDLAWENLTTLTLVPSKQRIKPTKLPMTTGKLEVTIKINELPTDVQTNKDNWKIFQLDCDGRVVSVTVKPKIWKKLEDAAANYPQWVAAIGGKMGESTPNGFVLSEPNIQVFEKKPKEPKPEAGQ